MPDTAPWTQTDGRTWLFNRGGQIRWQGHRGGWQCYLPGRLEWPRGRMDVYPTVPEAKAAVEAVMKLVD